MEALAQLETTTRHGAAGQLVVQLIGDVDLATAPQLATALRAAVQSPGVTEIVLDLTRLDFLDAAGLGVLVSAHQLAAALHRPLLACGPSGEVDTVLRVTGVAGLLRLPDVPPEPTVPPDIV